ncbi:MAG TPA: CBS domain-containing protein [Gammaproteobacteria bacterium]|nr:CBS domain-containing protein [Gammaproteobacteria bacterium]
MKIHDLMSTQVESILPTATLRRAAQKMTQLNIGSLPIISDEGTLLGIITDRDISCFAVAMGHEPNSTEVQKVMTKEVFTCFEDQDISNAANLMEDKHIRRLAVLNHDNNVVGFLSVDDLAHCSHELAGAVLEAATPVH